MEDLLTKKVGGGSELREMRTPLLQQQRVTLAAQYVASAVEGTPLRLEAQSAAEKSFAGIVTQRFYKWSVTLLVVAAAVLAPWSADRVLRGPSRPPGSRKTRRVVGVVLPLICSFLLVDCGFHMWIYKRAWTRQGWHQIRVAALVMTFFNSVSWRCAGFTGAPAFFVMAEFAPLRRAIASMARTVPTVAPTIAIFGGVVAVFAQVGVLIWKDCYNTGFRHDHDPDDYDDDLDVEFHGGFSNFGRAAWTLFVLSTTENYPFVTYPALQCTSTKPFSVPLSILYFTTYIFLVVYILINTLLAAFYSAWKAEHSDLAERDQVRVYHALLAAFEVLTTTDSSSECCFSEAAASYEEEKEPELTSEIFNALASQLRPSSTLDQREVAFDYVRNKESVIRRDAFLRRCRGAFTRILPSSLRSPPEDDTESVAESVATTLLGEEQPQKIRYIMDTAAATVGCYALVLAYLVSDATRDAGQTKQLRTTCTVISDLILLLFLIEHAIRFLSSAQQKLGDNLDDDDDPDKKKKKKKTIFGGKMRRQAVSTLVDRWLVIVAVLCRFLIVPLSTIDSIHGPDARRVAGACIAARSFFISERARSVAGALVHVWRVLFFFGVVFALVLYIYAAVAVELCAGIVPGRRHYAYGEDDDGPRDRMELDNRVTFNSLGEAWEGLFRIAVTNNWQDAVNAYLFSEPARGASSAFHRTAVGLFFVSFFILSVWFGTNIMAALVIDAIISSKDDDKDDLPSPLATPRQDRLTSMASDLQGLFERRPFVATQPQFHPDPRADHRPQLSARGYQALRSKLKHTRQTIADQRLLDDDTASSRVWSKPLRFVRSASVPPAIPSTSPMTSPPPTSSEKDDVSPETI